MPSAIEQLLRCNPLRQQHAIVILKRPFAIECLGRIIRPLDFEVECLYPIGAALCFRKRKRARPHPLIAILGLQV